MEAAEKDAQHAEAMLAKAEQAAHDQAEGSSADDGNALIMAPSHLTMDGLAQTVVSEKAEVTSFAL